MALLDESAEFGRHALDVLRQPLEEGVIRIARAARTAVLPSRFLLAATRTPCPCGFHGDPQRECRCTPPAIDRYHGRLSGPLRDRIDLSVWVPAVPYHALRDAGAGESSSTVRARVVAARHRQHSRRGPRCRCWLNARLEGSALLQHSALTSEGLAVIDMASRRFHLSTRSCHRVLRVARTIADLAAVDRVPADDVREAVQFRLV